MSMLEDPDRGGNDGPAAAGDLSQQDRDAAVAALDVHRDAGRLDDVGFEERSVRVARAGSRREVELLFIDLPDPHPVLGAPAWGSAPAPSPAPLPSPAPRAPGPVPGAGQPGPLASRGPGLVPEPYGRMIVALVPFAALVLFFVTGSWLWFLLIPVVAIVVRGPKNGHRR
jgi:hypothetical protein